MYGRSLIYEIYCNFAGHKTAPTKKYKCQQRKGFYLLQMKCRRI